MRAIVCTAVAGLLLMLAGCEAPPPETYVPASPAAAAAAGVSVGRDSRNEECLAAPGRALPTDLPARRSTDIFCGGWNQPAANVTELSGRASPSELDAMAAGGLWRSGLDQRFVCGAPQATTLDNGVPARLIACTRRTGGWPHLAVVAQGRNGPVVADGLVTTLPVIARQIAGGGSAGETPRSVALSLAVARLASGAFSAADIGQYEQLMALGRELNQVGNYVGAEEAYRAALSIQERLLGRDNPNVATALMHLALNLSNEGRRAQTAPLFARAEQLAPRAADPLTSARLLHYRGLDALNGGDPAAAARLLEQAERLYAAFVPPASNRTADDIAGDVLVDPIGQSAVLGRAEARRNRGVALARAGRPAEGATLTAEARAMLRDANLEPGLIVGRGLRTAGSSEDALGRRSDAARLFDASAVRFGQGAPGERPEAETLFLAGSRSASAGRKSDALAAFRSGAQILRSRQIALSIPLVMPYLDALWTGGSDDPARAAEMFAASQLAQRGQTSQLVAQASARLGSANGNPRVATSIRRLQDADRELRGLYSERDAAEAADAREFDPRIAAAQAKRDTAESEVAAAAPGYRQLLLSAVDAPAVSKALRPRDALVSMLVGADHGYVFAVRADGTIRVARLDLPESAAASLIGRVRNGMKPEAANSPGSFDTAAANAIFQAVLAPIVPALDGADTLLVAADGPFLSIPFGLLLTGPADPNDLRQAPWLIRRYAVIHVPSAQTLVTLRSSGGGASPGTQAYAGFGAPVMPTPSQLANSFPSDRCGPDRALAARLGPLPFSRAELEAARLLLGAAPDAVHLGGAFTLAAMRRDGLAQDRIVHLATHALLPGELSCLREPTLLVSSPPGAKDASAAFVPASELINLKLDADLVILSACNTGTTETGAGSGGEALSGLSRAFFFAGARGLLVTHWEVDDVAAARTVAKTLERQQAGMSSADALRAAQLSILDLAGTSLPVTFAHPFYWAPFALIGDGKSEGRTISQH